jgi:ABC-type transport system involved in multi-copper enzyme maturation permease subunit
MLNMKPVWSIARAEARVTRRLVRYWIFLVISYLLVFITYIALSAIHGFSTLSATAGLINPRFLVNSLGSNYLMIYTVGVVFLALDVRARDRRERMVEILDSRPYTNLELISGRFLGILIPAWVPFLILAIVLELFGLFLKGVGSPIGEPVEIYSLISYAFLISLPALAFVISIVFLVTLLVHNRLIAAVILFIFLGFIYWGMSQFPNYQAQLFDLFGSIQVEYPSDITFSVIDSDGILYHVAILFASFGILGICTSIHPRFDDGYRPKSALSGLAIVAIAAAIIGFIYNNSLKDLEKPEMWLKAHSAYIEAPAPDLQTITGQVNIVPGKSLELELDITFAAPESRPVKNAIFTLNPGQRVTKVLDVSGKPLSYTHKHGLLDITLPDVLSPGEDTGIKLHIEGIPDNKFAYLDSALNPRKIKSREGNLILLGDKSAIFDSSFVALMPGVRWLPESGPENERDNQRIRPVDYFYIDLNVRLPKGWLIAGPGRRHKVEEKKDYNLFRFSPPSVVPEVALIASQFESRSFEVDNVLMEFLIHKKHFKNIEVLSETGDKIQEWVSNKMKETKENGLAYPFDGFTLVEVPTNLRTYGGGWRLDTIQALPGIFLLKESSLPTARFDSAFRNPERFKDREGGIAQAKFERLQTFFRNDFSGGNVLTGAPRNFFLYQTSAVGSESLALNFVMETLSGLLLTDSKGYFSAHAYSDADRLGSALGNITINFLQVRGIGETFSNVTIRTMTSRPAIWEKALEVSLKDMDPWKDPADTLDVLTLKGYAISQTIMDVLGREKTAKLLSTIRNNHLGRSFTVDDMINAAKTLGYDLDDLLGDWIGSTELPGFIVVETEGYRIPDDDNGNPRYQLLFTVRNDEPVPGAFRFTYFYQEENQKSELTQSESIRLAGKNTIQYGTIVSKPPNMCFLSPYLSLNRGVFRIKMNPVDHEKIIKKDPIEGVKKIPWETPVSNSIVVDDLDGGFNIAEEEKDEGLRIKSQNKSDIETDQGLPYLALDNLILPAPGEWSRMSNAMAWGKYRHTAAVIGKGDGSKKALFSTSLPNNGAWDLEFYLPMKGVFPGKKWGTWDVVVKDSNGDQQKVEFDSKASNEGWNMLGKLDLPEGKITVELSDKTDGNIVVADAIRWTPSAGN